MLAKPSHFKNFIQLPISFFFRKKSFTEELLHRGHFKLGETMNVNIEVFSQLLEQFIKAYILCSHNAVDMNCLLLYNFLDASVCESIVQKLSTILLSFRHFLLVNLVCPFCLRFLSLIHLGLCIGCSFVHFFWCR